MTQDSLGSLIGALLPGMPLTVTGSGSLQFSGDAVEQYVDLVATFTVPDQTVEAPFDVRYAGTYAIDGDAVVFTLDAIEGGWGTAVAHTKAGDFEVPLPTPGDIPPIAGGPATCDDTTLTIEYTSGLADAPAVFERT
jgi:hypothetical protein